MVVENRIFGEFNYLFRNWPSNRKEQFGHRSPGAISMCVVGNKRECAEFSKDKELKLKGFSAL